MSPSPSNTGSRPLINPESRRIETEELLPLENHHIVVGRYNYNNSTSGKTKALTPAVKVYKKVRGELPRGKNVSRLPHIKKQVALLLQKELGYSEPPVVTVWVDIHKAEKDGQLEELLAANPQLRKCTDFDGDEVVFVQDHNDIFLQADLADNKKKRGPTKETPRASKKPRPSMLAFQLTTGCSLDEEVEEICCRWIQENDGARGLDAMERKSKLVKALKSYIAYYKDLFQRNNPCCNSPASALKQLNETLLIEAVNTLGNSMVEWYQWYPSTCLPGEANAWNEDPQPMQPEPLRAHKDSDMGSLGKGSLGTYEVMGEDAVDWACRKFSDFTIGSEHTPFCSEDHQRKPRTLTPMDGSSDQVDDSSDDIDRATIEPSSFAASSAFVLCAASAGSFVQRWFGGSSERECPPFSNDPNRMSEANTNETHRHGKPPPPQPGRPEDYGCPPHGERARRGLIPGARHRLNTH